MASRNDAGPSPNRRFPPPWSVDEQEVCIIVRDKNGQAVGYFYFEDEPRRRAAAKLLSRDESRRIAANVAKLPKLLRSRGAPETTSGLLWPGAGPSAQERTARRACSDGTYVKGGTFAFCFKKASKRPLASSFGGAAL